jgi:hypothetical protein
VLSKNWSKALVAMAVKGGDAGRHMEGLVAASAAEAGGERGAAEEAARAAEARATAAEGRVVAAGAGVEAVRARVAAEMAARAAEVRVMAAAGMVAVAGARVARTGSQASSALPELFRDLGNNCGHST